MKNLMLSVFAAIFLVLFSIQVRALSVSLVPQFQIARPNDVLFIDLIIDGLITDGAGALGAYSFIIGFDSSVVDYLTVGFGSSLGETNPNAFETFSFVDSSAANVPFGQVYVDHTSLLSTSELESLQSDSFLLNRFAFRAENLRASAFTPVVLSDVVLSDSFGFAIDNFDINNAGVTVTPIPTSIGLFLTGLSAMVFLRRRISRVAGDTLG